MKNFSVNISYHKQYVVTQKLKKKGLIKLSVLLYSNLIKKLILLFYTVNQIEYFQQYLVFN